MNKIKIRRIKKKIFQRKSLIVLIILSILLFSLSCGYALLKSSLNIFGIASIEIDNPTCDLDITSSVTFDNTWGNDEMYTHVITVSIVNNSSDDINGWNITMKGPKDLDASWVNGNVTQADGIASITNYDWNATILSGDSFSLVIGIRTVEETLNFEYITFNGCKIYDGKNNEGDNQDEQPEIILTPIEQDIKIGEQLQMNAIIYPESSTSNFSWSSSSSDIATVSQEGIVTAIKEGSVYITVTSNGMSATSKINVLKEIIDQDDELIDIIIPFDNYTLSVGQSLKIDVEKNPNTSSSTILWTSSNEEVLTTSQDGLIRALSIGNSVVTVASENIKKEILITVVDYSVEEMTDIGFEFKVTGSWDHTIQYEIILTNNTGNDLYEFSFDLNMPDDTAYTIFYYPGLTINGNTFNFLLDEYSKITSETTISGQLTIPSEYDINDYTTPSISNVKISG